MKWIGLFLLCIWSKGASSQNTPIELEVQTSTRYYTDGTSKTSAKMLWSTEGVPPQGVGFLGNRIKPYLSEVPAVQKRFTGFRAWSALQLATGIGTLATLPMAFNRQEAFPDDPWYSQFKAPLICGVSAYATAIFAGIAFNRTVEMHNALIGKTSDEGFSWVPRLEPAQHLAGASLIWTLP